jgi:CRISPR-associated protein Csy2
MKTPQNFESALLVLPRISVQNANCISSPLTWGFPAITAFSGLTIALERRLGNHANVMFKRFGIVCHSFDPQVNVGKYETKFNLTRNPIDSKGDTSAIVEEGRAHMVISLLFEIRFDGDQYLGQEDQQELANIVMLEVQQMRIAGGSVLPDIGYRKKAHLPSLMITSVADFEKQWRKIRMNLLPGYALVSRDDLLIQRLKDLKLQDVNASSLDALLDLSRLNRRAYKILPEGAANPDAETIEWRSDLRVGWIVPITVGYAAISKLYEPGVVANARDRSIAFQFVENIYSMGQWISPHRITQIDQLLWQTKPPDSDGVYRCANSHVPSTSLN